MEDFGFRRNMILPAPAGLDESEEEAAAAASSRKRPEKAKKGKGASRGENWRHCAHWEEEGKSYWRDSTKFSKAEG